jgi:hypothetical protein
MGVLLHQQSGNEDKLDFFVSPRDLAQNKPKKVLKVDVCVFSRFTTRKSAILCENLKNAVTLDEFGGKRHKSRKSMKLGEIAFFTDVFHACRLVVEVQ